MRSDRPIVKPDSLYTMAQTAAILGVSRSVLYKWRNEGSLRTHTRPSSSKAVVLGSEIVKLWTINN